VQARLPDPAGRQKMLVKPGGIVENFRSFDE
jgi:hypothetical protein